MRIIISFVIKEFKQLKRDKRILPLLIIAPVLQLIVLGYAATFDIKHIELAVFDLDKSKSSRELIERFTSSSYFVVKYSGERMGEVNRLFGSGRIKSALIIPAGFEKKIYLGENSSILFVTDGTEGTSSSASLIYARSILSRYIDSKAQGKVLMPVKYEMRIWYNPELKTSNFMVPAIFALLLLIVTMLIPSMALVKEKEKGTIEQLYVTPIKPYQIIIGKMAAFLLISILDVILVSLVALFWFDVPMRGDIFDFSLAIMLFLFTTLGVATFFSSIARSQQQAMMSVMFLFLLPSMLLSGFIFPVENIPYSIRWISYCLPFTYFIEILRSIFLKGNGIKELYIQYAIMGITGIIIFMLSLLRFKRSISLSK